MNCVCVVDLKGVWAEFESRVWVSVDQSLWQAVFIIIVSMYGSLGSGIHSCALVGIVYLSIHTHNSHRNILHLYSTSKPVCDWSCLS